MLTVAEAIRQRRSIRRFLDKPVSDEIILELLEAERLAAVGQTVAGLAHTVKNLLMGLEGGMYMVDSGLRRGEAGRIADGWEILQRNFEKTTALVKDFLSFAKGRVPDLRPTDPVALARSVVELYRDAARRQGVELVLEPGEAVAEAPLDPDGVETALTNLVSNAIQYSHQNATVAVSIRRFVNEIEVEVKDEGVGIKPEDQARLFQAFTQGKNAKGLKEGTGLGLVVCQRLVEAQHGRIWMESELGQGSTFYFALPALSV
jgi:signal transduction histidine kinase